MPADVFERHTPELRRLELLNVRVPWSSPILSGLKHLYIELSYGALDLIRDGIFIDSTTPAATHDHFYCALERMPDLETIHLETCLPEKPQNGTDTHMVALPRLQKLIIHDSTEGIRDKLEHLEIPPSCVLDFDCEDGVVDDFSPFLRRQTRSPAERNPLLTFSLSFEEGYMAFEFWRVSAADDAAFGPRKMSPDINIWLPEPETLSIHPIRSLCDTISADTLRALILGEHGWPSWWTARDWIEMFGRCAALEHVFLTGWENWKGAQGSQWPEGQSLLAPDQLFLPSLRWMELVQVDIHTPIRDRSRIRALEEGADESVGEDAHTDQDNASDSGSDQRSGRTHVSLLDTLEGWLRTRAEAGGPRLTLVIKNCTIYGSTVDALGTVAEVKWDGATNDYQDRESMVGVFS